MKVIETLMEIAESGVVQPDDPRIDWVDVQIDRELWQALQEWAQERQTFPICGRCQCAIKPGTMHEMFNGNQMFACVIVQKVELGRNFWPIHLPKDVS